ncbi:MAG: sensor domain-containing diguanylate cyclase [Acidobacteriota bacterium]
MRQKEHPVPGDEQSGPSVLVYSALIVIGMIAPALTFMIAVSGLTPDTKIYGLAATSIAYFAICFWSFKRLRAEAIRRSGAMPNLQSAEAELTGKLLALEEANEFFGASLQPADTFRLVTNRIRDLYDFDTSVLFVVGPDAAELKAVQVQGTNQKHFRDCEVEKGLGLAGLAILSGEVEFSSDLNEDRSVLPAESLAGLRSSAAIPIFFKGESFGVLQMFSAEKIAHDDRSREILGAVGERIGPLLRGSIAHEESLSSALTDPLTNLPNERAFFMILENQLAESIRFREERPLSVLALDIKGFDEVDPAYESGEAERLLTFVGDVVRGQLRKMDFLARSNSDEFLVILPTASRTTADEVVKRIQAAFTKTPFTTLGGEDVKIWLNIGRSCFWKDGETANQLLQSARIQKQQAKSQEPETVLWFPKEYVN